MPPCVLSVAVDGFWFAPLFKSVQVLLLSVLSCGQSVSLPVYMLYSLLLLVTFISFIFLSMVSRSDMRDNITQDVVSFIWAGYKHFISFHFIFLIELISFHLAIYHGIYISVAIIIMAFQTSPVSICRAT